ncbi:MAG: NAD-dependent epimerase/dehydratase family protein, partial [Spirochaetales bacterium]|nr:NAD-dependent epimerase/dehydratase family protein [Spirochaetales bacterium]
ELLHETYNIVAVDKKIDRHFYGLYQDVLSYELDISEFDSVKQLVDDNPPDYVVNLVSVVSAARDLSMFSSLIDTNLNVLITLYEALKECEGLKLFIQFGSAEEYGSSSNVPFKEGNREYPDSPYALIKQLTSNTALMLHRNYGFPSMVVRPSNLYGKYQEEGKLIPYIVRTLLKGENLSLTPGEQKRDFLYCSDLVHAIDGLCREALLASGRIINIAAGESVSIKRLVEIVKVNTKSDSKIVFGAFPYRQNEMMDLRCDTNTLHSIIADFKPVSVEKGIQKYIESVGVIK